MADFKSSVFLLDYTGTELIEQRADYDMIRMCKKVPRCSERKPDPAMRDGQPDAIHHHADVAV